MQKELYLENKDGESLLLWIAGYEFPDIENQPYDSNWLNVGIEVALSKGKWTAVFPCALTTEIEQLIKWFTAIGLGQNDANWFGFIEPNLGFDFSGTFPGDLRIRFAAEYLPEWAGKANEASIHVYLDKPALLQIIDSFETMLAEFPTRVDDNDAS